eukprot:jgi/Hompol1/615/HPOL_001260-RA
MLWDDQQQLLAITCESKVLHLWKTAESAWTLLNTRQMTKRPISLLFDLTADHQKVLVGDKFGDVLRYDVHDVTQRAQLMLGHVSMLTDCAWSHDHSFILTTDRDEKIRISKYPHAYEIHQFCFGHEQFISRIMTVPGEPDVAISGGGDPYIMVWDYLKGVLLQRVSLLDPSVVDMKTTALLSIRHSAVSNTIAVIFEQICKVFILDAKDVREMSLKQTIVTEQPPLDIVFDLHGHLWITYAPVSDSNATSEAEDTNRDSRPLVEISELRNQKFEAPSATHSLVKHLAHFPTPTVDKLADLFELHKLRKWSGNSHYLQVKREKQQKRDELLASKGKPKPKQKQPTTTKPGDDNGRDQLDKADSEAGARKRKSGDDAEDQVDGDGEGDGQGDGDDQAHNGADKSGHKKTRRGGKKQRNKKAAAAAATSSPGHSGDAGSAMAGSARSRAIGLAQVIADAAIQVPGQGVWVLIDVDVDVVVGHRDIQELHVIKKLHVVHAVHVVYAIRGIRGVGGAIDVAAHAGKYLREVC